METILITGGSGLLGMHLTKLLLHEKFEVIHLSRNAASIGSVKVFQWNVGKNLIDAEAMRRADHIIHLAGASVAKYWTSSYKKELLDSRVKSAALIFDFLSQKENKVKSFISSSAVGYYGDGGETWLHEEDVPGNDFLSEICLQWEAAAKKFESLNKKVAIIRTGIVLAKEGGTLPALLQPLRFGIAPIFGSGKQFYPWIHLDDVCRIFLFALQRSSVQGAYNAVAPEPARFRELINAIAIAAGKRKLNLPVPEIFLKTFLDGFGSSALNSARCSSQKIEAAGFQFKHHDLHEALKDLFVK